MSSTTAVYNNHNEFTIITAVQCSKLPALNTIDNEAKDTSISDVDVGAIQKHRCKGSLRTHTGSYETTNACFRLGTKAYWAGMLPLCQGQMELI